MDLPCAQNTPPIEPVKNTTITPISIDDEDDDPIDEFVVLKDEEDVKKV